MEKKKEGEITAKEKKKHTHTLFSVPARLKILAGKQTARQTSPSRLRFCYLANLMATWASCFPQSTFPSRFSTWKCSVCFAAVGLGAMTQRCSSDETAPRSHPRKSSKTTLPLSPHRPTQNLQQCRAVHRRCTSWATLDSPGSRHSRGSPLCEYSVRFACKLLHCCIARRAGSYLEPRSKRRRAGR